MKIGQLDMHCGNCNVIDYCAEPFDELCLCTRADLQDIEEDEYIKMAEEIQQGSKRYVSNEKMADRICRNVRKKKEADERRFNTKW